MAMLGGLLVRETLRGAGRRGRVSLNERLAYLPAQGLPLQNPVTIRWNEHQVPFIPAESDGDLAVAIGTVHAHLRYAQMEILRRARPDREMIGPLGIELDHGMRILGLAQAAAGSRKRPS
jgi:penicillin amidase